MQKVLSFDSVNTCFKKTKTQELWTEGKNVFQVSNKDFPVNFERN